MNRTVVSLVTCAQDNCSATREFVYRCPVGNWKPSNSYTCKRCGSQLSVSLSCRSGLVSEVIKRGKDVEPQYVALAGTPERDSGPPSPDLSGAQPTLTLRGWCADIVRAIRWRMR